MSKRRNSLLIHADRVVIELSPVGASMTVTINNPTSDSLIQLISEASQLLETRLRRGEVNEK